MIIQTTFGCTLQGDMGQNKVAAYLESKLGEEPLVLAGLVSLLEGLLDLLLGLLTLRRLLEGVVRQSGLERVKLKRVTGRHDVVEVDDLDERLDLGSVRDLLGAVLAGDLERVALNAGNEGVAEGVRLRALLVGLDDHNLLTGVLAAGDNG